MHLNRLRTWIAMGILLLSLSLSGCQSLTLPWSSSHGLPSQWEPGESTAR
jgi:hypothetical protein